MVQSVILRNILACLANYYRKLTLVVKLVVLRYLRYWYIFRVTSNTGRWLDENGWIWWRCPPTFLDLSDVSVHFHREAEVAENLLTMFDVVQTHTFDDGYILGRKKIHDLVDLFATHRFFCR